MAHLPEIPFEISPQRIAGPLSLSLETASDFLERSCGLIKPSGVFSKVSPQKLFGHKLPDAHQSWGSEIIAGAISLGPDILSAPSNAETDHQMWNLLIKTVLQDTLDFVEYKVGLYLKPDGLVPGDFLLPGCDDLPLEANAKILQFIEDNLPEAASDLKLLPSGEINPHTGMVFIYTCQEKDVSLPSKCLNCSRKSCPSYIDAIST